jgi:cytochrome c biogenesis protein CcdA
VIATPPGWGPHPRARWLGGILTHVLGLPVGALAAAAGWHLVGVHIGHPPRWLLGVLLLALALVAVRLVPVELEGSPWRVPREWANWGRVWYGWIFGASLGTGLATKLTSPALYGLFAWGVTADSYGQLWPAFAAFALGRAVPFAVLGLTAYRRARGLDLDRSLNQVNEAVQVALLDTNDRVRRLAPLEAALAVAAAMLLLLP